ncbi:MAG: dihydropteroate synthase, partial [Nitrososphaerales archaeon]
DLGAMSTAPYLENEVPAEVERDRIASALRAIAGSGVTVSVDTMRASVAESALRNGATVVNDVSGLRGDPRMAAVVKDHGASLLAMAHSSRASRAGPLARVGADLEGTLRAAVGAGIEEDRVVLDPGIGFYREEGAGAAYSPQRLMPWDRWDATVLAGLEGLRALGRPLCVGLSRKSFLGRILGLPDPDDRLPASVAAAAIAVMNGAAMVRTHDVAETLQAVRVAEAVRSSRGRAYRPS